MKSLFKILILGFLFSGLFSPIAFSKNSPTITPDNPKIETIFDQDKWRIKQGKDYPFRDEMVNDIVYTNKFRTLSKSELLNELGEPSYYRDDKNYLHYIISQTRLLSWPLHTKVLVIKLTDENSVDWIKIHE